MKTYIVGCDRKKTSPYLCLVWGASRDMVCFFHSPRCNGNLIVLSIGDGSTEASCPLTFPESSFNA